MDMKFQLLIKVEYAEKMLSFNPTKFYNPGARLELVKEDEQYCWQASS